MNKLYLGKVVGTHGIKGEIKILPQCELSKRILVKGTKLYFDNIDKSYNITSCRFHKNCYLTLLDNFTNINEVLFLNKHKVYVNRDDFLDSSEYVYDDLIGFDVVSDDVVYGKISDYDLNNSYCTFLVTGDKNFYLPNVPRYVRNVDLENKKVYTIDVGDLII